MIFAVVSTTWANDMIIKFSKFTVIIVKSVVCTIIARLSSVWWMSSLYKCPHWCSGHAVATDTRPRVHCMSTTGTSVHRMPATMFPVNLTVDNVPTRQQINFATRLKIPLFTCTSQSVPTTPWTFHL